MTKLAARRGRIASLDEWISGVPEILDVSIKVFASEGRGVTQRRVASDAGIRLVTLQHIRTHSNIDVLDRVP